MSENTNPQGSVDNTIGGAANAFMSILDPQTKEAQADPEVRADDSDSESYDEPQGEESDVSAEETEYQEEAVEESPKYRVKANGEELEVSLDELLNGYSRTADYQKKTQSLAEQRKSVEAERVKIDEAARTRDTYAQRLQVIEQLLNQKDSPEEMARLKEEDPLGWQQKMAEQYERDKQLQAVQAERQRVSQEQQTLQGQRLHQHIQSEQEKLKSAIPDFKDDAKAEVIRRDIRSYAKSIGFSDQELSQVYDSRAVQTLYKAMQYEKLVAGKAGATKKVTSAPKTLKPGTSNPQSSEQEAKKKDFAQLRKTGNKRDAARLFERFL
jgi:Tfp pilus assembly protein PilN